MEVTLNARLLRILRHLADEQGRPESAILEDAVVRYLRELGVEEDDLDIGRPIRRVRIGPVEEPSPPPLDPFLALLDRMSSRFDLDEDEAMRIAVEEQQAFRRERSEREGTER